MWPRPGKTRRTLSIHKNIPIGSLD
jgi:hypothetical protein